MMDAGGNGGNGVWGPEVPLNENEVQWPLSYSLIPPLPDSPQGRWWSHDHYRGPGNQPIRVLYSSSMPHSEIIAQEFLNEPVLGFDMEWPSLKKTDQSTRLQTKIALIQLACERKVALFHIALHDGQTTDEIIAPSLRRIIESPGILKVGVAILESDFKRIKDYFHIQPRGAFELSHLHYLVTLGSCNPNVTQNLCSLSKQVKYHLGLPLYKGNVRMSNWSVPLDDDQRSYAADDAYAGFMLFHCMNAKRLGMSPVPPLPKLAEYSLPLSMLRIGPMKLASNVDDAKAGVMATESKERKGEHGDETRIETPDPSEELVGHIREKFRKGTSLTTDAVPEISQRLYARLVLHRERLAKAQDIPDSTIASDKVLEGLARYRPTSRRELLKLHGIGKGKVTAYGDEWLQIITNDLCEHLIDDTQPPQPEPKLEYEPPSKPELEPDSINTPSKRRYVRNVGGPKELLSPQPFQSTGLSFELAETRLDVDGTPVEDNDVSNHDEPESKGPAMMKSTPSTPLKRKRTEELASLSETTHTPRVSPDPIPAPTPAPAPAPTSIPAILPAEEPAQPELLSWEQQLLRQKLDVYVKSVIWATDPKPTQAIVSEQTLHVLVTTLPSTLDEFNKVPNIQEFVQACQKVKKDPWLTFSTWTRAQGLVKSPE